MALPLGTLAWAAQRGGALTSAERALLALQGIALVLRENGARWAARWGFLNGARLALAEVPFPASAVAAAAEALARAACAPWLYQHCLRTWAWAALLARRDGVSHDPELLYLASLLHDLGITQQFATPPGECFAVRGARAAQDWLGEQGVPPERARLVAEAIVLHLNVRVGAGRGPEARLIRQATALDVTGQRVYALSRQTRDEVLARHPRVGFKREIAAAMAAQAAQSPDTRIGFLCHRLQLHHRAKAAPFAD